MKMNPKAAINVDMLVVWLAIPAVLVAQEHQKGWLKVCYARERQIGPVVGVGDRAAF